MFGLTATDLSGEILDCAAVSQALMPKRPLVDTGSYRAIPVRFLGGLHFEAHSCHARPERVQRESQPGEVLVARDRIAAATGRGANGGDAALPRLFSARFGSRALPRRGVDVSALRGPRVRSRPLLALLVYLFRPASPRTSTSRPSRRCAGSAEKLVFSPCSRVMQSTRGLCLSCFSVMGTGCWSRPINPRRAAALKVTGLT